MAHQVDHLSLENHIQYRKFIVAKVTILPADRNMSWLFEPNVNPVSVLVIRRAGVWGERSEDGVVGKVVVYHQDEFFQIFEPDPERAGWYREWTRVRAVQLPYDFSVTNSMGVTEIGKANDWLVEDIGQDGKPVGKRVVSKDDFRSYMMA